MNKKMTNVEKSIHEKSEKITHAKKAIKKYSESIDNLQTIPEELSNENWKEKQFLFPDKTVRLGTIFSGIGAIEHAFQRLKLILCKYQLFAQFILLFPECHSFVAPIRVGFIIQVIRQCFRGLSFGLRGC